MTLDEHQPQTNLEITDQPAVSGGTAGVQAPGRVSKNARWFLGGGGVVLLLLALAAVGGAIYRVYAGAVTDRWTMAVARTLRLPALKVNGIIITYADYADDLAAIRALREYERSKGGPGAALSDEQMSDQVLLRLVNVALVAEAAQTRSISLSEEDLAGLRAELLKQFKDPSEAEAALQKRYGWNLSTYEQKVMRPYLFQQKLAAAFESDAPARAAIRRQAEAILAELKQGGDFEALAKKHGQDGTALQGGDLGWFGRGQMVPQFEAVAFALKKGELSKALTESPFGYHIIKVDDRKTERVKDTAGKMTNQEQTRARHILFRFPSLESYLDEALRQARIQLYLKAHNPFSAPASPPGKV